MSYQLVWKVEKRVIFLQFPEKVGVDTAQNAGNDLRTYFDSGDAPVHFVVDMRRIRISPTGRQTNLNLANSLKHKNLGWVVTIGGTPLTKIMMPVLSQMKQFKLKQVDSEAAAMAFLQKHDDSLKALI